MAILYVMIGIPGSGKTTYAKNIKDAVVVSSDEIRYEITGSYSNMNYNSIVFNKMEKRIKKLLEEEKDVVYDATNITRWKRQHIVHTLKYSSNIRVVFIFMNTRLKICLERNEQKGERMTPENVLADMFLKLEKPSRIYEQCDDLLIVNEDGTETLYNDERRIIW